MANASRVNGLIEEILDAGKTPEEEYPANLKQLAEDQSSLVEFRLYGEASSELLEDVQTTVVAGAAKRDTPSADLPQIPGYELSNEVGRGGMGIVYRARDRSLDRDVAVKLLQGSYPVDSSFARRFADEARITAQLQHPGIPP